MSDDDILCYCMRKRKNEVIAAWHKKQYASVEAFMEETKLGTVCTSCRSTLEHVLVREPVSSRAAHTTEYRTIYSKHQRKLTPAQKLKRWARSIKKHYFGMHEIDFHTVYRLDDGFESAITISNLANPDFPDSVIDLTCTIACFAKDGTPLAKEDRALPYDTVLNLSMRDYLGESARDAFGLAKIYLRPAHRGDSRRWKIGSGRPYLNLTKNGRTLTIHEKAVLFDQKKTIPGIAGSAYQRTIFVMANIEPNDGTVRVTLRAGAREREDTVLFTPYSSALYEVPERIDGAPVDEVAIWSDVHISGYQYAVNKSSALISVQHLVKEGN